VVIYSAANYARISDFWALKVLVHEFAHAQQLEHWPENQPDIVQAFEHAAVQGLYKGVKDDKGKVLDKAYAAVNQLEYFAELSCMYFVGCNYQPFDRKELEKYDPDGYAMVETMWGVKK
jgi:dipeptidyl-peptidase-4